MKNGSHVLAKVRVEEQSHARLNMSDVKWTIGIESTAHTFSFGLVDPMAYLIPPLAIQSNHSKEGFILEKQQTIIVIMQENCSIKFLILNNLSSADIGAIAYSQGPGLGPCLRIGASVARTLSSKLDVPSYWRQSLRCAH